MKKNLIATICVVLLLFSIAAHASCFPTSYPSTVNAGNVLSGDRVCFPADGSFPSGCAILTFASSTTPGSFTKTVETFPGLVCPDHTQQGMFVKFTGVLGAAGDIRPKYQVVGVDYAPPGAKSTATYTNGFMSGTSTSNTQSFKQGVTVTSKLTGGGSLFGILSADSTSTASGGWSQERDTSNSITVVQQQSTGLVVPGPAASGAGVNHDYDTIYIWLNPEVSLTVFPPSTVYFNSYVFDQRDTVTGMDVVPLTVGQLRGTQAIPTDLQARLNRTWDTSLGGLTVSDFADIVKADPFATNPSFNPNTDTSGRYELPDVNGTPQSLIFNYIPSPQGVQPTGETFTSSYTNTSVAGQKAIDTATVGYSVDGSVSISFFAQAISNLMVSTTYTYTNEWSQTVTSGTSQSANFTIFGPLFTDGYTGPTAMQIWKDNVYGTFMFFPEN